MATTLAKQRAVAIAPKFTAFASAVGSAVNMRLILRGHSAGSGGKKPANARGTYHRLVLGMSVCDLSASVAWFMTTWPIPAGTPGAFGASGNQKTCSAQAFFAQFSLSTVMYNASLALYYLLVIRRGWKDSDVVKIEPCLHLHSLAWGLGTAVASLALTLFNQVGWDCWISAAPLGCQESWNSTPDSPPTCVRGDNGSLYQWAFYYAPLWFVILLVSVLMYRVYSSVRGQERKMERYAHKVRSGQGGARASVAYQKQAAKVTQSKRIAGQCFAYLGAFYMTWLFPTIFQLVIVTSGQFPFPLLFLTALFVPLQGLLNLIVFIRPKFVRYRRQNPDAGCFLTAWFALLALELGFKKGDDNNGGSGTRTETEPRQEDVPMNKAQSYRLSMLEKWSSSRFSSWDKSAKQGASAADLGAGTHAEERIQSMENESMHSKTSQAYSETSQATYRPSMLKQMATSQWRRSNDSSAHGDSSDADFSAEFGGSLASLEEEVPGNDGDDEEMGEGGPSGASTDSSSSAPALFVPTRRRSSMEVSFRRRMSSLGSLPEDEEAEEVAMASFDEDRDEGRVTAKVTSVSLVICMPFSFANDPIAVEAFRRTYAAFVVDHYQTTWRKHSNRKNLKGLDVTVRIRSVFELSGSRRDLQATTTAAAVDYNDDDDRFDDNEGAVPSSEGTSGAKPVDDGGADGSPMSWIPSARTMLQRAGSRGKLSGTIGGEEEGDGDGDVGGDCKKVKVTFDLTASYRPRDGKGGRSEDGGTPESVVADLLVREPLCTAQHRGEFASRLRSMCREEETSAFAEVMGVSRPTIAGEEGDGGEGESGPKQRSGSGRRVRIAGVSESLIGSIRIAGWR